MAVSYAAVSGANGWLLNTQRPDATSFSDLWIVLSSGQKDQISAFYGCVKPSPGDICDNLSGQTCCKAYYDALHDIAARLSTLLLLGLIPCVVLFSVCALSASIVAKVRCEEPTQTEAKQQYTPPAPVGRAPVDGKKSYGTLPLGRTVHPQVPATSHGQLSLGSVVRVPPQHVLPSDMMDQFAAIPRGDAQGAVSDSVVRVHGQALPPDVGRAFGTVHQAPDAQMLEGVILEYSDLEFGPKLAHGSFGQVFRGRWKLNEVAIKVLATQGAPQDLNEFRSEALVMTKMRSDYIVQLRGYCESPYCLVMEWMPKGSLYALLHDRSRQLPWAWCLRVALDVCCGLTQLHEARIVHRDLKSPNILLHEAEGSLRAKVGDFGLSLMKTASSAGSMSGAIKGTLPWMAPELLDLNPKYSTQSDIYSLGLVLWELAERRTPFANANSSVLFEEIKSGRAKEQFSQATSVARVEFVAFAQSCWLPAPQRPTAAQAANLMRTLLQAEMRKF